MTREELLYAASVMTAAAEGQAIEGKHRSYDVWGSCATPHWDWSCYNYRVKPEPKEIWLVRTTKGCDVFTSFEFAERVAKSLGAEAEHYKQVL